MNNNYSISIDNNGNVVVTQITTMTPEEYLRQAAQIYNFQSKMNGVKKETTFISGEKIEPIP